MFGISHFSLNYDLLTLIEWLTCFTYTAIGLPSQYVFANTLHKTHSVTHPCTNQAQGWLTDWLLCLVPSFSYIAMGLLFFKVITQDNMYMQIPDTNPFCHPSSPGLLKFSDQMGTGQSMPADLLKWAGWLTPLVPGQLGVRWCFLPIAALQTGLSSPQFQEGWLLQSELRSKHHLKHPIYPLGVEGL